MNTTEDLKVIKRMIMRGMPLDKIGDYVQQCIDDEAPDPAFVKDTGVKYEHGKKIYTYLKEAQKINCAKDLEHGMSRPEAALKYNISESTVCRINARYGKKQNP